jgi:hypothetical protein
VKAGGNLFEKMLNPFGKEGDIGDDVMTTIVQQKDAFLVTPKQHIIQNLNDIGRPIDITTRHEARGLGCCVYDTSRDLLPVQRL